MPPKTSGSHKLKKSSLPKFNHDIYPVISSSSLIVYSVRYLSEQEMAVKLDDVVFICFVLFPQKFALKKYPRWPDSALVSRHLGDCRSEGYIAANTDPGFKLTMKGLRLAEKTAKILGVLIPKRTAKVMPVKKVESAVSKEKMPAPAKIPQVISSQPKAQAAKLAKNIKIALKKKTTLSAPVKKVQPTSPKADVIIAKPALKEKVILSAPTKKVQPTPPKMGVATAKSPRKEKVIPPTPAKKVRVTQSKVDLTAATSAWKEKIILPAPMKKVQPSGSKATPSAQVKKVQPSSKKEAAPPRLVKKAQSIRPVMIRTAPVKNIKTPSTTKIKPVESAAQPDKAKPTQLALFKKINPPVQSNVSQEAKIRAGKFTRMMERSEAYIHYKKNGNSSKISEFDFRSLLLCTMESSADTLARNVELFKGYADIHNRRDLMAFLNHCEDKFSYLLKPQSKLTRKAKK